MNHRVAIVGGGIVGLATAHELSAARPDLRITVFEKEAKVGKHQTGNNSGVLHAGLYYAPGSFKARLAVAGIRRMKTFCAENKIPFEECGKLVVAVTQDEVPRLEELYRRGIANGLKGLRILEPSEFRKIEPHVAGVKAVHVPEEGIVSYPLVSLTLQNILNSRGVQVKTETRVTQIEKNPKGHWLVESVNDTQSSRDKTEFDLIINCAGLYCDRVAKLAGESPRAKIVPFRGEYYMLKPERQSLVKHLIYPVPDPAFPFLGVHFTRMIGGGVECGPNAVLAMSREGYTKTQFSLRDFSESITYPGLWRFLIKYPSMAGYEIVRSLSREVFCNSLKRLIPDVKPDDLMPGGAGVRAQAMLRDGSMVQDFEIVESKGAVHVLNAPSPGATSSLAIGEEIVSRALKHLPA